MKLSLSTTLHLNLLFHAKSSEHTKGLTHKAAVESTATQAHRLENKFAEKSARSLP